jgi:acylphosphatase
MADQEDQKRRTVYYSGRVQGVGFRYATREIAQEYCVRGYVRNLDDGRVEVVAEGVADEIGRFLNRLNQTMNRYIRETQVSNSPATGEFESFEIER